MKKKRTVMALGIAAAVCLVCLAFAIFRQPPASGNQTAEEWMQIPSRYHVFSYPKIWESHLRIETEEKTEYTVAFYGVINEKEQRLFDYVFGQQPEGKTGTLKMENGQSIAVGIVTYDMLPESRWQPEEWEMLCAMQEDVNVLFADLPLQSLEQGPEEVQQPQIPAGDTEEDLVVETAYCRLHFPLKWEEALQIAYGEDGDRTVAFYGQLRPKKRQKLFSVGFDVAEGSPVGTISDGSGRPVTVSVLLTEFHPDSGWTEEEADIIYEMQEAVNYLIQKLPLT